MVPNMRLTFLPGWFSNRDGLVIVRNHEELELSQTISNHLISLAANSTPARH